jgi:hypothetical protein
MTKGEPAICKTMGNEVTMDNLMKHPGGRPTKYRKEYCQKLVEFFSIEPTKEVTKTITTAKGTVIEEPVERAARLPTFERFAVNIGACVDTLIEWTKKHKEFSEAYTYAKALQKDILVTNGLLGLYDAGYAKFVSINCTDMRDRQERAHEFEVPENVTVSINITPKVES